MVCLIERHRTAFRRRKPSRALQLLLDAGLLRAEHTFFDYGCGRGDDIVHLKERGIAARGWDPYYRSETMPVASDVVALTYVINVIEDLDERAEALRCAWGHAEEVLVVSAQVTRERMARHTVPYGDGVLTGLGTFQKYYTQTQLEDYIEGELGVEAYSGGPGIFLVFRDPDLARDFAASSYFYPDVGRPARGPNPRHEQALRALEPLMRFFRERGRFPRKRELEAFAEPIRSLGGIKRAERFVRILLA